MTRNVLPPLSELDRRDKMELWLGTEVLNHEFHPGDFYDLLESHFALVSTWRTLQNRHAKLPEGYEPTNIREIERF